MTPSTPPILDAHDLERRFGQVVALRGVNFAVYPGEIVWLAGPNGAGKSTLLRCLAGLSRPTRGSVRIRDQQLTSGRSIRSAIGFLSHQTFLYDDLTARENLRFAATLHGLDAIERRVQDVLDAAGLTQRADTLAGALSHGLKRRLAIARATVHSPDVLLLDEPFSGLDVPSTERLRAAIANDASNGRAVVCATHQGLDLWSLCSRVVVLERGRVIFDAPRPAELDDFLITYSELLAA